MIYPLLPMLCPSGCRRVTIPASISILLLLCVGGAPGDARALVAVKGWPSLHRFQFYQLELQDPSPSHRDRPSYRDWQVEKFKHLEGQFEVQDAVPGSHCTALPVPVPVTVALPVPVALASAWISITPRKRAGPEVPGASRGRRAAERRPLRAPRRRRRGQPGGLPRPPCPLPRLPPRQRQLQRQPAG